MTAEHETAAVVGVAGGVGATRITVETAATLARAGRDVVVLDVALETQGLADYVAGGIDADAARLYTERASLSEALSELDVPLDGDLAVCPASAPFEVLARAKTAAAARRFESAVEDACTVADHVLVDVPPVATNPSVAAVTTVDRVGVVAPPTERGHDALQRLQARLEDVGTDRDVTFVNRGDAPGPIRSADVAVPDSGVVDPTEAPAVVDPDAEFAPAVATAAEELLGVELDLSFPDPGVLSSLR